MVYFFLLDRLIEIVSLILIDAAIVMRARLLGRANAVHAANALTINVQMAAEAVVHAEGLNIIDSARVLI